MTNNSLWSKTTGGLYTAVLVQTISGAAANLFLIISAIMIMSNPFSYALGGGYQTMSILTLIAGIGSLVGFILFFMNIAALKGLVDPQDAPAVSYIHTAMILTIINAVLSIIGTFVPFLSIIVLILSIVALVFQLMGYSALKNSATFPTAAREGAGKIFNAIIISLIGGFVAGIFILLVPVISIIAYAAVIYAWILQLQGWALIAKSEAPM